MKRLENKQSIFTLSEITNLGDRVRLWFMFRDDWSYPNLGWEGEVGEAGVRSCAEFVREESRNIGHWRVLLLRFDSEAQLAVLVSTFSVSPITGDTVFQLLEIFKELELTLESVTLRTESDDASLCISRAVGQGFPAFQVYPMENINQFIVKFHK